MIVQSSWKVSDDRPVSDAVVASEDSKSPDLEDEVMAENCLMLEAPEIGDGMYPAVPACQLLISCEPPNQISRITVLCEARVIEVYGHHGEYLKTVKNEMLEEAEDMVVFRGDVTLDRPSTLCSIKFLLLRSNSEMWLYGVKIHTTKVAYETQNHTTVPLAAVEQRLVEMGLALSDKAEAFKQLVQSCQNSPLGDIDIGDFISNLAVSNLVKNKSPSPEARPQTLSIANIAAEYSERRDNENNLQQLLNTYTDKKDSLRKPLNAVSMSTSPVGFECVTSSTQTEEDYSGVEDKLKAFVAEQMETLDKNMWEKINKRFLETEAKIMCKLEEIESFVKPHGVIDD